VSSEIFGLLSADSIFGYYTYFEFIIAVKIEYPSMEGITALKREDSKLGEYN